MHSRLIEYPRPEARSWLDITASRLVFEVAAMPEMANWTDDRLYEFSAFAAELQRDFAAAEQKRPYWEVEVLLDREELEPLAAEMIGRALALTREDDPFVADDFVPVPAYQWVHPIELLTGLAEWWLFEESLPGGLRDAKFLLRFIGEMSKCAAGHMGEAVGPLLVPRASLPYVADILLWMAARADALTYNRGRSNPTVALELQYHAMVLRQMRWLEESEPPDAASDSHSTDEQTIPEAADTAAPE